MALSNPITWQNMCAEFSLNAATAVFPRDFYSKGGAPATGTLGFQDFVGRSNGSSAATYSAPGGTTQTSTVTDATATVIITANKAVTWTYTRTSGTLGTVSIASGASATSIEFDLSAPLNTTKSSTWSVSANDAGTITSWTVTLNATNDGQAGG